MRELKVIARMTNIKDINKFKEIAKEAISITQEEPGTLQYEFYLDEENTTCTIIETYKDSDAVENHVQNVGEILQKVSEICDLKVEVYGEEDEKGAALAAQFGAKIVPYFGGVRMRHG